MDRGDVHGNPRTSTDPPSSPGQASLHTHKSSVPFFSLCWPAETELAGDKTTAGSRDTIKDLRSVLYLLWLPSALLPSPMECFWWGRGGSLWPKAKSRGVHSCFQMLALNARHFPLLWYFCWVVLLLASSTFCVTLLHVLLLLNSSQFFIFFALETQI